MPFPLQTTVRYADAVNRPVHEQELVSEKATQTVDVNVATTQTES